MMSILSQWISRLRQRVTPPNDSGQATTEYALMLGGIALVLVFVVGATVAAVSEQFREAACDLITDGAQVVRCGDIVADNDENTPPVAIIQYVDCRVNEDCSFVNKNSSYDLEDTFEALTCEWDFEDIGTSSLCEPTDITPHWTEVGRKDVSLTVTDTEGLSDTFTQSVQVTLDGPNQPPMGNLRGRAICIAGEACGVFKAEVTDDNTPDHLLRYFWEAEDGNVLAPEQRETNIIFNEPTEGSETRRVTVTVTDSLELSNTFTYEVSQVRPGDGSPSDPGPNAVIRSSSPTSCTVGQDCGLFDGSLSSGDTPLTFTWSIENGSGTADNANGETTDITFGNEGTWNVYLTVTEPDGDTDTDDIAVTVTANDDDDGGDDDDETGSSFSIEGQTPATNAPAQNTDRTNFNIRVNTEAPSTSVDLHFYVTQENASDTYLFSATNASISGPDNVTMPANQGTNLVYYTLTLTTNGEGQRNINGTINHANPGTTDSSNDWWADGLPPQSEGFQPVDTIPAYVGGTQVAGTVPVPPQPGFNINTATGRCIAGQPCNFTDDSTGSTHSNVVNYAWDFQNDGTVDVQGSTSNAQWQFPNAGTYTVRYQVEDALGMSSWMTRQVTVDAPQQNDPPSGFDIVLYNQTNRSFNFGVQPWPTDPENDTPFTFNWDFGDGDTLTKLNNGNADHTYDSAGSYTVTLTVQDSLGNVSAPVTYDVSMESNEIWVTDVQVTTTALSGNNWQIDSFGFTVTDAGGAPLQGMTYQGDFNGHYSSCVTDASGYCDIGPARQWSGGPVEQLNQNASVDFQFSGYHGVNGKTHIHANNTDNTPEAHVSVNGSTITITKP
jgi:PKD repeat protein/Flp pilus assembly pilin Flp